MSTLASVFGYGLLSARAAAAVAGRFYYATDTTFMYRDNGSSWDTLSVGAGSMATDALWDAAGDLAVGTGANTAAKLTLGAVGKAPISTGSALAYAYPPGHEFDYAQATSEVTPTATTEGTANTVVSGNSVAYDGGAVVAEFFCADAQADASAGAIMIVILVEGATVIGRLALVTNPTASAVRNPLIGKYRFTPSAASHTFVVKAYVTTGTGDLRAGAGGSATSAPMYLQITKA